VSAALIGVEAVSHIVSPRPIGAGAEGVVVMLVSMALTGGLIAAQTRALQKTGSVATAGDRAHYAADLAANLVVILGLAAGVFLNMPWVDAVAGLAVAVWLAFGAWGVGALAADHLMDRELPEEDRIQIRALALEDQRIRGVHDLRTRTSGPYLHIQFHADLDPDLRLFDAHQIVAEAEARIRAAYPAADVIVHPDPQNRSEPHGHELFAERRGDWSDG
jgi:cation diffusion facilitator family transporter